MEYTETHPWLSFEAGSLFPEGDGLQDFMFKLGEAASKVEHLAHAPLLPSIQKELNIISLVKGVAATTAIEGNTLGEAVVRSIIENKAEIPPSQEYQRQEVANILEVCNELISRIAGDGSPLPPVTVDLIKHFNAAVLKDLEVGEDVVPGRIRRHSVIVGRYRGAPAEECGYLLGRLVEWLDSPTFQPHTPEYAIPYALIQAIVAHIYLAWIHPFGDGNGRTARLLELYILMKAGVPTPAAHLLSDHYNLTRDRYYFILDQLPARPPYKLAPFLSYALQGFLDGIRRQIESIQHMQMNILWEQHIHQTFAAHQGIKDVIRRQRKLALYISAQTGPVALSSLEDLPPALYDVYRGKTKRTLTRDVNALISMELARSVPGGLVACRELVMSMRPYRAAAPHPGTAAPHRLRP